MNLDNLVEIAEKRSKTYWFLGKIYSTVPDIGFIVELREKLPEKIDESDELLEVMRFIRDSIDGNPEELSKALSVEFTRLFRGIKKDYGPPPPYESVYRGEGRVMGETTLSVLRFYSEAGIGIIDESEGPQDYIGVEMKFMSLLCYKEMESWKNRKIEDGMRYLKLEKKFLEEHILKWVPDFCRRIEVEAREDFYAAVARLTEKFIRVDAENLEILLDVINETKA